MSNVSNSSQSAEDSGGLDPYGALRECVRWLVASLDPLTPTHQVASCEEQLREAASSHPEVVEAWMAGVLVEVGHTLPAEDRWRTLAAVWPNIHDNPLLCGLESHVSSPQEPLRPGVWCKGVVRRLTIESLEVMPPSNMDPTLDSGVVALVLSEIGVDADVLDMAGALALAAVGGGVDDNEGGEVGLSGEPEYPPDRLRWCWSTVATILGSVRLSGRTDVVSLWMLAFRWVVWRRRIYVGSTGDFWLVATGFSWVSKAINAGVGGSGVDWSAVVFGVESDRIETGSYLDLVSMRFPHPFFPE